MVPKYYRPKDLICGRRLSGGEVGSGRLPFVEQKHVKVLSKSKTSLLFGEQGCSSSKSASGDMDEASTSSPALNLT